MNIKSFTLVELIIVAIIVGLLGFVAIPSMLKSVNRAYAKDAMQNLMALYGAQVNYAQEHGGAYVYCGSTGSTVDQSPCLNAGLGTNIIPVPANSMVYSCENSLGVLKKEKKGSGDFVIRINTSYPINNTVPVYCTSSLGGTVTADNNPCCLNNGHSGRSSCP